MKYFGTQMNADCRRLFRSNEWESRGGLIYRALAIIAILMCISGCEKRIVRKQERVFMHYAEQNWNKLSPRQKTDYYEMIERQKDRARKEEAQEKQGSNLQGF